MCPRSAVAGRFSVACRAHGWEASREARHAALRGQKGNHEVEVAVGLLGLLAPASPRPEDSAPLEPGGMKAGKRENRNAFRRRRDASRKDHRVHLRTACAQHRVGVRALGTEPGAGSWSLLFPRKRISPSRSRV